MKTTLSVLFSDMRGSAGAVTASIWKGRNYVRTRVTPANPNTAAQQAQRVAFSSCVGLYQLLGSTVKAAWSSLAQSRQVSELNSFMSSNVADEKADVPTTMTPSNSLVGAPSNVVVATGAAPGGDIDITWDAGDTTATDALALWYRRKGENELAYTEPAGATMADGAYTLSGLEADTTYGVAIAALDPTDGYSLSQGGSAAASSAA